MTTFPTFGWLLIACGAVSVVCGLVEARILPSSRARLTGWGAVAGGIGTTLWGVSLLDRTSWGDDPGPLAWIGLSLMLGGAMLSLVALGAGLWARPFGPPRSH